MSDPKLNGCKRIRENRSAVEEGAGSVSPTQRLTDSLSPSLSLDDPILSPKRRKKSPILEAPRSLSFSIDSIIANKPSSSSTISECAVGAEERERSPVESPVEEGEGEKEGGSGESPGPSDTFRPTYPAPRNSETMSKIQCRLEARNQWVEFFNIDTEMIITKSGRRMFPPLRASFLNCERESKYVVMVDIVPVDNKRYRYAYHKSSWLVAGKADPPSPIRLYMHPDSPFSGDQLSKQIVSFEKLKLTNNELDKHGHVILNSMHKYQPRIHLIKKREGRAMEPATTDLEAEEVKTFVFQETQFMAVTAYQNQLVTKLKIDSNPFAKGFRDSTRLGDFDGPQDGGGFYGDNYHPGMPRFNPALGMCSPSYMMEVRARAAAAAAMGVFPFPNSVFPRLPQVHPFPNPLLFLGTQPPFSSHWLARMNAMSSLASSVRNDLGPTPSPTTSIDPNTTPHTHIPNLDDSTTNSNSPDLGVKQEPSGGSMEEKRSEGERSPRSDGTSSSASNLDPSKHSAPPVNFQPYRRPNCP